MLRIVEISRPENQDGEILAASCKKLSRQETPNSVLEEVYVLNQKFDT